ncbi:MAG: SDR family NAD(P)-dependent oxidoreductase [Synergistaceae bacterium]|nr:SDR family NAD(P)-dependent oxidoreductase [Synergistaceae bacterium]
MNPFNLTGKKILITGASSGIGRAAAVLCSQMGAELIITGRNKCELDKTFANLEGNNHEKICADLLGGGGHLDRTGFTARRSCK